MHVGGRFFWVGHHARPSDSTESSSSTSLLARPLVSQNSVKNTSAHAASACAPELLDQQISGEWLGLAPQGSSPGSTEPQHCRGVEGSQLGLPGQATEAEALTLQHPKTCLDSTSGFGGPSMSTTGIDSWATDYSPEDVDQLWDWAAEPKLQLSLSKSEHDPAAFSMCGSLATGYNLPLPLSQGMQPLDGKVSCSPNALEPPSCQGMQGLDSIQSCSPKTCHGRQLASAQGRQGLDRQLSCSWDDEAFHSDVQGCLQDPSQQTELYSDSLLASPLLPGLEGLGGAASPMLSASSELMIAESSGRGSGLSGDPLDQLMESACCSSHDETGQQSSPVSALHGNDCSLTYHNGKQEGSAEDRQGCQKKRCGRPRVYDLDTPIASGIASNAVAVCDNLRGSSAPFFGSAEMTPCYVLLL